MRVTDLLGSERIGGGGGGFGQVTITQSKMEWLMEDKSRIECHGYETLCHDQGHDTETEIAIFSY